jgi:hypothetical protein
MKPFTVRTLVHHSASDKPVKTYLLLLSLLPASVISPGRATAEPVATNKTDGATGPAAEVLQPGDYRNWVTFGIGSTFISGDRAAFKQRSGLPRGPCGGVEDFHYEQDIGKRGLFEIDGRGIFDNHDYGLSLGLAHPDIGYVRGGYREFRSYYDGSGGFSPASNAWVKLYNEELFIDRGQAWIEAGLTLPDLPVFTVRYAYEFRDGQKDSTIWGDYSLSLNNANVRGIVPTFRGIDEHRHIIDADVKHTIGSTAFGVGLRYERDDIRNTLNIRRRPGELTRTRAVTQLDDTDAEILSPRAFVESRLHPNVLFTAGGAYTRLDTDIGGSRIYGRSYGSPFNPLYLNRQNNDEGFLDLSGGTRVDQYVVNLNLMITPWQNFVILPGLRFEHQDQVGESFFTETRVSGTNAPALQDILNTRARRFTDVSERIELRYNGLTNWVLYARGEWLQGQGTLRENEFDVEDDGTTAAIQRETDSERFVQKYVAGVNWYPHRRLNVAAQYYYRTRRNDYDHPIDTTIFNPPATNNFYPAFIRRHEFNTHDVNGRVTLRPLANLTLVSRYDFQATSYNTRGGVNSFGIQLDEIESAQATSHIFNQSISWAPFARLYLQGSVSYAVEHTDSPAVIFTGPASNLVQNAENDYWNASAIIGYALTRTTDLQAEYFYYRADNYVDNSTVSVPFGAGAEQHGVTGSVINRFWKNFVWKIQYGFFTGHDQTSGAHNDDQAHLVYSSWQYFF